MEDHLNNLAVSAEECGPCASGGYVEPQGDLERAIAQLWQDLFHVEAIGRNDNFFELGGNSLLGMDLAEMLATRLALEVPVLTIFQHPTVAQIARVIASQ